jgi:ABC-type branched-subunit amino acid transport system ATPase component
LSAGIDLVTLLLGVNGNGSSTAIRALVNVIFLVDARIPSVLDK